MPLSLPEKPITNRWPQPVHLRPGESEAEDFAREIRPQLLFDVCPATGHGQPRPARKTARGMDGRAVARAFLALRLKKLRR